MGSDGMQHTILSATMTAVFGVFMPCAIAAILTMVIGVVKEVYDKYRGGRCEWKDLVCDIIGILIGAI